MKYKILILTIILLLFTTAVSAQEKPIANAENISQISIGSTSMFMDQHEKYNLNIYYPETKYIAYRINSISGDQKRITPVSDGNSLMITVNYSNGEQFIFSVEPYGISINSDLGYVIQKADYNRFLNLLADVNCLYRKHWILNRPNGQKIISTSPSPNRIFQNGWHITIKTL